MTLKFTSYIIKPAYWLVSLLFLSNTLLAMPGERGWIVVDSVSAGGQAEKAGLRAGDKILAWSLELDGRKLCGQLPDTFYWASFKDSQSYMAPTSFSIERDGAPISLITPLGIRDFEVRPEMPAAAWGLVLKAKAELGNKETQRALAHYGEAEALCERKRCYGAAAWVAQASALAREKAGEPEVAEGDFERACRLADRTGDAIDRWQIRRFFALFLKKVKNSTRAIAELEEALAIILKEKCDPLEEAACLNELGTVAYGKGDLDKAERCFRRAYEIRFSIAPETLLESRSSNNMGVLLMDLGRLADARPYCERTVAIKEKHNAGTLDLALSLNNLGVLLQKTGDLEGAEASYARSLELKERLAPGSDDLAVSLNNLGALRRDRGDLQGAETTLKRALAIYEANDPSSKDTADTLLNLGLISRNRGDLALAETLWRRSLSIYSELRPGSLDVARALNNLALVAEDRADLDEAARLYGQALEIKKKIAPDSLDVASTLDLLGVLAKNNNDIVSAKRLNAEALEIRRRHAPDSAIVAASLNSLAELRGDEGDLEGELAGYLEVLELYRKFSPGSLNEASVRNNLAGCYWKRGERDRATTQCDSAIEIRRRLAPASASVAESCYLRGLLSREGGERASAVVYMNEAVGALEAQRERLGGGSGAMERFSALYGEIYKDLADLLVDMGQKEEAFSVLERYRARALIEMLAERDLDFRRDAPEELLRQKRLLDKAYDVQQEDLAGLDPEKEGDKVAVSREKLAELRAAQRELEAKIKAQSPRLASLRFPQPLDVAGASAALPKGRLLLSYSVGAERTLLFALLDGSLEVFAIPIKAEALQLEVRAFRREVADPAPKIPSSKRGRALYARLVQPASKLLERAQGVLICADGPLHALPFAALQNPRGKFFGTAFAISRAASITVFAEEVKRAQAADWSIPLAAFGDPVYSKTDGVTAGGIRPAAERMGLASLPFSKAEVDRLCAMAGQEAKCFTGAEATESRAISLGPAVRRIHFACHGILDERFPLDSALVLSPPAPGEAGNGSLQAWEIFEGMRIDAELVTLSACETALGLEMGGEGLVGLTRAFQYAGARNVMATLWPVSDGGTVDFMARFYGHLVGGATEPEALRLARAEVIAASQKGKINTASYWAAFELIGSR